MWTKLCWWPVHSRLNNLWWYSFSSRTRLKTQQHLLLYTVIFYCYLSSDINHWLFKIWNSLCTVCAYFMCSNVHSIIGTDFGMCSSFSLLSIDSIYNTLYTQHNWYHTMWFMDVLSVSSLIHVTVLFSWQKWCNKQWKYMYVYVHDMCCRVGLHVQYTQGGNCVRIFNPNFCRADWMVYCYWGAVFEHFGPLQHYMRCLNWSCTVYQSIVFHVLKNSSQIFCMIAASCTKCCTWSDGTLCMNLWKRKYKIIRNNLMWFDDLTMW